MIITPKLVVIEGRSPKYIICTPYPKSTSVTFRKRDDIPASSNL
uniref:Uncharacterized protein n=1 Tax=Lepeophtheirus salmonis TaxID=72036 RepID=A0A0K2TYA7_LEPSM